MLFCIKSEDSRARVSREVDVAWHIIPGRPPQREFDDWDFEIGIYLEIGLWKLTAEN